MHWLWLTKCDFLLFYTLLPDSGRPSLLVPTRTPSQPLSTQGPGGSCIVRCPGDSSSPSSHTNPKSTARSPFIEVTESKVSLCLLLLGKAGPLCLRKQGGESSEVRAEFKASVQQGLLWEAWTLGRAERLSLVPVIQCPQYWVFRDGRCPHTPGSLVVSTGKSQTGAR